MSVDLEIQFALNIRGRRVATRGDLEREWKARGEAWKAAEQKEADRIAAELLDRHLTPEQRKMWYMRNHAYNGAQWMPVTTKSGRKLHITRGYIYNVFEPDVRRCYCAGPTVSLGDGRLLPLDDYILGQLIILKSDERLFFDVANTDRY